MSMTSTLPEPHQDIIGADRGDDPLLTEAGSTVALHLTKRLWSAVLVGNQAPVVKAMYEEMSSPAVGVPVVISDAWYTRDPDTAYKAVGYLVAARREWATTHDKWQQEKTTDDFLADSDRGVERSAFYVQYGPAAHDICRWVNATPVAIVGMRPING